MRVRGSAPVSNRLKYGLLILVLGVVIGGVADPVRWLRTAARKSYLVSERGTPELHWSFVPNPAAKGSLDNDLDTIHLTVPDESATILQDVRDRAMQRKLIIQGPDDIVPAELTHEDNNYVVDLRIKGDWTDHVNTDKWSYRIKIKGGAVLGMRVFSIQHPRTRGFLWEWLVLEAARRENILAPRSLFVNVVINGNPMGVYFLEEHPGKEMLETQGRREGPIVLFDESTLWTARLQTHMGSGSDLPWPSTFRGRTGIGTAEIRSFGEQRLSSVEPLQRMLSAAIAKMENLRKQIVTNYASADRAKVYDELASIQDTSLEQLFDIDSLARTHALTSLLRIRHALIWHNMRFYFDPVLERLEPVMFDNMAHEHAGWRDISIFLSSPVMTEFARNTRYYNEVFRSLGRFCQPEYLDDLFADIAPEMELYAHALAAEYILDREFTPEHMFQALRSQQIYLKKSVYPKDAVNFSCRYELSGETDPVVSGLMQVKAWPTTKTPVVVEGFRFSNGIVVPASTCIAADVPGMYRERDGAVVLPNTGRPVTFEFSMDQRLANLQNVRQIKKAIRDQASDDATRLDLEVHALYRPIADHTTREELLRFRRHDARWDLEGGRPVLPTLDEALQRYECLEYKLEAETLYLRSGTWSLAEDLLIPSGYILHARAGVTLRFPTGAALVTDSALRFRGEETKPVILEPLPGNDSWSGVAVLSAEDLSIWSHVVVRNTDSISRGGWVTTGGITFYHSPVDISDTLIDGTLAEDGLNIYGTETHLGRLTISGCVSDSFDGDFITGTISECVFKNGLADGLDVSGSEVLIENCLFENLDDKAISVGENSRVTVAGGVIEGVSLGVVAKDLSMVEVDSLDVRSVTNYAFAVYEKKPEFGPAQLFARDILLGGIGLGLGLVQTGSVLTVNGTTIEPRDFDVDAMYEEGLLGN